MLPDFPTIVADESLDGRIIRALKDAGITDARVIEIAVEKRGYIITEDKDFGDALVYRKEQSIGSMLLRISDLPIESRIKLVIETITHHTNDIKNCSCVLTSKKLRIRKYL